MAKNTIEIGDLKITLEGPDAVVEPDKVTLQYFRTPLAKSAEAVEIVAGLGGVEAFHSDGNREDEKLVQEQPGGDVRAEVYGPPAAKGKRASSQEVFGRWKDRAVNEE
jgi:hypothetical protein